MIFIISGFIQKDHISNDFRIIRDDEEGSERARVNHPVYIGTP